MINRLFRALSFYAVKILNVSVLQFWAPARKVVKTRCDAPLILVLGPPRSGTTFFVQTFVKYNDVSYFSNLHNLFYSNMCVADILYTFMLRFFKVKDTAVSDYGKVKGILSPSEGGKFWNHYFSGNLKDEWRSKVKMKRFFEEFNYLRGTANTPLILKNLFNVHRIRHLRRLKNIHIVVLIRPKGEIVNSIVKGALREKVQLGQWFSVPPRYDTSAKFSSHVEQASFQVDRIYENIQDEINRLSIDATQVHYVELADLVSSPKELVTNLMKKINHD